MAITSSLAQSSSCRGRAYRSPQLHFTFPEHGTRYRSGHNRQPKAAPVEMIALASVGLVGSGIALGTGECRIRGIFGSYQGRGKPNAANIEQIAELTESLAEDVFKLRSNLQNKLFMVTTQLAALKSFQTEMLEIQNRTWKVIQEGSEIFEHNIGVFRHCDQLLFS